MSQQKRPAKPHRLRKTKRAALIGAGVMVAGILSFPIWSAWVAKPLAARAGVEIGAVERLSWDRWRLQQLSTKQAGIEFAAEHAELPSPAKLLLEHFSSDPATGQLSVEDWSLDISPQEPAQPSDPQDPLTLPGVVSLAENSLGLLANYLAQVTLQSGSLALDGQKTLDLPSLQLSPNELSAALTHTPTQTGATLQTTFASPGTWQLSATVPKHHLALDATLQSGQDYATLDGALSSYQNPIDLSARWTDSFLPDTAQLQAHAFELDQRYAFWESAPPLSIDLDADWNGQRFDYRLTALDTNDPTGASKALLTGTGSQTALEIETAQVDLPWLTVQSDRPIRLDFTLENPLETAQLEARLDLAKVPFLEADGHLQALLQTRTGPDGQPLVTADLQGSDIALWDSTLQTVSARLELLGSEATVRSLDIHSAAGSSLILSGGYHLQDKRFLESQLELQLENESQRLRDLLPALEWQALKADFTLAGALTDPQLAGTLAVDTLKHASTAPFSLTAALDGTLSALRADLHAATGAETLDLALTLARGPEQTKIELSQLALAQSSGAPILSLAETSEVTLSPSPLRIASPGLALTGPNGQQLELSSFLLSDSQLELHATAIDFDTDVFNGWLAAPAPTLRIQDFDTKASLSETQSQITTSGVASWQLNPQSAVNLSWLAKSDPNRLDSLSIDHLDIGADSKHIVLAKGNFPVSINWSQGAPQAKLHFEAPLAFSLQSSPNPDFWASLQNLLPVGLKRPVVKAQLSGTLKQPQGHFDLALASLVWRHASDPTKNVQLQDLSASLHANTDGLALRSLHALAGRNSISAQAALPINPTTLADLVQNRKQPDLSKLTAQASVELLELEALKSWLPALMRQEGKAMIELALDNGDVSGTATIENFATRPMPPLGALSKISGQIEIAQGVARIRQIRGLAEKSPFSLTGAVNLADPANPLYDLAFTSKEFPLVRDDGLLLSGDIDMKLVSENDQSPLIKGSLNLTKGLFLVEPDLLASSTKTVSSRPPYFSVEPAPFNEWGLDVDIRGKEFLRVSNSFFEGTLSAEFDLEGTLGSPLLIGKAETNTGRIFFPASSLNLKSGQALITRERPSELQLEASAEGRLFAYDINLDVGGTVDDPELVITSNPALTQVDALLLLTTGALPNAQGNLAQKSATSLGLFIGKGLFKKLTGGNSDSASKLSLEVGQDISRQGKKTIDASYQLTDDLEIEGEYDKRDEFNANLKWTIFQR